jgi:hypothetical protein
MKITEITQQWPAVLRNGYEIAQYIESVSSEYVDEEQIEEVFHRCHAVLQRVPIGQLVPGPADNNIPNKRREAKFAKMPAETMPPLVIWNNQIQDGNHRYRVALRRGDPEVLCYVVVER